MILLIANRLDVLGECEFRVEAGTEVCVTRDPVKAAKVLSHMGLRSPMTLVDHAREWGSVEILEGHPQLERLPEPT